MDQPLVTPRLTLRPFRESDRADADALWTHPKVARWIGDIGQPIDTDRMLRGNLDLQASRGFSMWAVEDRESGALVGEAGLQPLELRGPEIEIGWTFAPDVWGRGLATEAARAWLDVAWDALGLDRVIAVVLPDNGPSRRVAEKLGMREEGVRDVYRASHVVYAISRPRRAVA